MDYNTDIFIETPLHLIFHGIMDDVIKVMHKFMSEHNMLRGFENLVNRDLSGISTLRLEWCKTKELPKNMVRRKRIGLCKDSDIYLCTFFLGMKLPQRGEASDNTLNDIQRMLSLLHVLICKLMSPNNVNGSDINLHVKIFLSCCD